MREIRNHLDSNRIIFAAAVIIGIIAGTAWTLTGIEPTALDVWRQIVSSVRDFLITLWLAVWR